MADRTTTIRQHNGTYRHRSILSASLVGMDLGELRKLVAACDGIPDNANVFVAGLSVRNEDRSKHWVREIHVQHSEPSDSA